jgi:uncharacterized protein (TIGR02118 family)
MIKVSVIYSNRPGVRFDHEYYRSKHLPLIERRMGAGLKYYTIDKGLSGSTPGVPATYVAACHLLCDSLAEYQASFGPYAQEITGDIANFTDVKPIIQISEVVVENSASERNHAQEFARRA